MRLSFAPSGLRCVLPRRVGQRSQRAPMTIVRAQGAEQGPAVAEQQQAAAAAAPAKAAAQQQDDVYDETAVAVADVTAEANSAAEEQQAWQAVAPPPPPADPRGSRLPIDLQHPGFKIAGALPHVLAMGARRYWAPTRYWALMTAARWLRPPHCLPMC